MTANAQTAHQNFENQPECSLVNKEKVNQFMEFSTEQTHRGVETSQTNVNEEQTTMAKEVVNQVEDVKQPLTVEENKNMTFVDRTYKTKRGLARFLATLTPAQLAEAQVLVDDDNFVVFYPLTESQRVTRHFDSGSDSLLSQPAVEVESPMYHEPMPEATPAARQAAKPNLDDSTTDEEKVLKEAYAILLAGVRL